MLPFERSATFVCPGHRFRLCRLQGICTQSQCSYSSIFRTALDLHDNQPRRLRCWFLNDWHGGPSQYLDVQALASNCQDGFVRQGINVLRKTPKARFELSMRPKEST